LHGSLFAAAAVDWKAGRSRDEYLCSSYARRATEIICHPIECFSTTLITCLNQQARNANDLQQQRVGAVATAPTRIAYCETMNKTSMFGE
jgi:hypothetical protein